DDPEADGFAGRDEDDRDRLGGVPGRDGERPTCRHDHGHVGPDELREPGGRLPLAVVVSIVDGDVLALDVPSSRRPSRNARTSPAAVSGEPTTRTPRRGMPPAGWASAEAGAKTRAASAPPRSLRRSTWPPTSRAVIQ